MDHGKNFKCDKCGKTFKFKSILLLHSMKCDFRNSEFEETSDARENKDCKKNQKMTNRNYTTITNSDSGKNYQCKSCGKKFNALGTFHQHFIYVHKEKKLKCEHCDKLFPINSSLNYHKKLYHSKENVLSKCDICDKVFKNARVLGSHINQDHIAKYKEKKLKCDNCDRKFAFPSLLKVHSKTCQKDRAKIKCEKCDKVYPFKSHFKKHVINCDGIKRHKQRLKNVDYCLTEDGQTGKRYKCNKCEKTFTSTKLIRSHVFTKHKERKFRCEHCDKLFAFNHALNHHIKMDHKNGSLKPKCDICEMTLKNSESLLVHKNNNHIENTKCQVCDKAFKNPQILQAHFNHCHRERKFNCMNCEKRFPYLSFLKIHSKTCKKDKAKIKCDKCDKLFSFKSLLKSHKKNCDGIQRQRHRLKNVDYSFTEDGDTDKRYKCNKCEKTFRSTRLIRSHIFTKHKERKFRCELCDKLFAFNYALNQHIKNDHKKGKDDTTKERNLEANKIGNIEIHIDDDVLKLYA